MTECKRPRRADSPAAPAANAEGRAGDGDTDEPSFVAVALLAVFGAVLLSGALGAFGDYLHQTRRW
ncbi:hypothetical protein BJ166DRAFT_585217 [Pestalotiopsis sp. NC0098]|nr:hypothetical protein BJ166DRAFT_585217 [Pestalotiopsis sp. NC0098]